MIKQKRLGQHFLNSNTIAKLIVSEAKINSNDIVFELGTGKGILTPLLCQKAHKVISIELDKNLVASTKHTLSNIHNLVLKSGDGLKNTETFSVFVSNIPYSKSRAIIEWLAQTPFSHGVIMVQKEFANKLTRKSSKRSINIIANHVFDIQFVCNVNKNNFYPEPKVNSTILKIIQKNIMNKELIQTVNKFFSYRRKTIKNILKQFNKNTLINKRIDDLTGDEIINFANQILEK